ncbi:MAG: hypothetical protein FJ040_05590 [Chloroflexi bacterium]|nr:hypothetical protein [Chloroflexota bacterium]
MKCLWWRIGLTSAVLLILASCGQPIQPLSRTPLASRTPVTSGEATAPVATDAPADPNAPAPPITDVTPVVEELVINIEVTPQLRATPTGDERWAAFASQRQLFDTPIRVTTLQPTPLLWLDPHNGQVLEIGLLNGDFVATAQIVLTSDNSVAYEVDYRINQDFGLTSISEAVVMRMRDAGYAASVRAFVVMTDNVVVVR